MRHVQEVMIQTVVRLDLGMIARRGVTLRHSMIESSIVRKLERHHVQVIGRSIFLCLDVLEKANVDLLEPAQNAGLR